MKSLVVGQGEGVTCERGKKGRVRREGRRGNGNNGGGGGRKWMEGGVRGRGTEL